ncbi:MAG: hypothetical protein PV344_04070 [Anaplasma sp.]|nr:hypothetical protein [Anaplasma sp.]
MLIPDKIVISRIHFRVGHLGTIVYCKRLNFREDLIFTNFANHLRFSKK